MKNLFVLLLLVLMALILMSCDRKSVANNILGPTDPPEPPPSVTLESVQMLPVFDTKTPPPPVGWHVKLHAFLQHYNPLTHVTTDLEPFTPMDMGAWTAQSTWSDFSFNFRGSQYVIYGVQLSVHDPITNRSMDPNVSFVSVATYSNGIVDTLEMNKMFQVIGGTHDGRTLHGGYLYGFRFISGWHMEAWGEHLVEDKITIKYSYDAQSNFTIVNGQLHYISADSLFYYNQPLNPNSPHIIQCSHNFFYNTLGTFNNTTNRHEFEFSGFPGDEFEFTVVQESPIWEQKLWGLNVSVGTETCEFMNLHNFGSTINPWILFFGKISPSGVPYNLYPRDDRVWGIFGMIPGKKFYGPTHQGLNNFYMIPRTNKFHGPTYYHLNKSHFDYGTGLIN